MDAEEIAGKYSMKGLRPIAKKYGAKTHCVKKIDVVRSLSKEALEELETSMDDDHNVLRHIGFITEMEDRTCQKIQLYIS